MKTICCVYGKEKTADGWIRVDHIADTSKMVFHGYCPECAKDALVEAKERAN